MNNYKKTQTDSPAGLFFGKEEKQTELFHIYWKQGKQLHPMFIFNKKTNRFKHTGGISEISPEALRDLSDFGAAIFDK